jgi:SAM-dependent methyltransferase
VGLTLAAPISLYDRLYLRFFYLVRSWKFDLPENQVGWRSRKNQELRFEAIAAIGDLQGKSILDLGCGLGCLYGYLKDRGWEGDYTGYDILGSMVKGARKRFPEVRFEKRDILREPVGKKWDFILINGVFNHKVRDNWAWIEATVTQGLKLAREGVSFNLLNAEEGWMDADLFYVRPAQLEEKVKRWSGGKYKIVRSYMPEDMTVFLYP